jgi:hypothetical protein
MTPTTARQKEDDHDHDGKDKDSDKDNDKEDLASQDDRHCRAKDRGRLQGGQGTKDCNSRRWRGGGDNDSYHHTTPDRCCCCEQLLMGWKWVQGQQGSARMQRARMKMMAHKQDAKCKGNEEDDHDRERARMVASIGMAARGDRNGTNTPRMARGVFLFLF